MTDELEPGDGPEPWERQAGEHAARFEAFATYRDAGPDRTIRAVAQRLGKSASLIARWSADDAWQRRIEAWEQHLDKLRREAAEQEIVDMAKRHATVADAMLDKVAQLLETHDLLDFMAAEMLNARDVATWLKVAVDVGRLSRGVAAPSTKVAVEHSGEITHRAAERAQRARQLAADPDAVEASLVLLERLANVGEPDPAQQ